jgi:hypothetical protein
MAKVPTQVVIAAYHDEGAADEVADALKKAKRRLLVYYRNVAVIRKTEKGKVKIKETGDMSGGVGAGVSAGPERPCTTPVSPTNGWNKSAACSSPAIRPSSPSSRKPR